MLQISVYFNSDLKEEKNFVETESTGPARTLGNDHRQPGQGQHHSPLPVVLPGPMGAVLQMEPAGQLLGQEDGAARFPHGPCEGAPCHKDRVACTRVGSWNCS